MSLTASPIRRYGSSSLKMRSPISAISAGIASRQHSACSDILPSAPISVIFLLLPPLLFYHPLLFQQTLLYLARGARNGIRGYKLIIAVAGLQLRVLAPAPPVYMRAAGAGAGTAIGDRPEHYGRRSNRLANQPKKFVKFVQFVAKTQSPISNLQSLISSLSRSKFVIDLEK